MTVVLRADATPSSTALLLRPWYDEDLEPLIEAYRDPTLRRWTRLPVESTEDALHWLGIQAEGWASGTRFSFAVLEDRPGTGANRLLANVALKRNLSVHGSAEVGYWTAAPARGQGVAPRALDVLTAWAFDTFAADGLERLELRHQVDNLASCRVAEKARYEFDQVIPAYPPFPRDGHLHTRHSGECVVTAGVGVNAPACACRLRCGCRRRLGEGC